MEVICTFAFICPKLLEEFRSKRRGERTQSPVKGYALLKQHKKVQFLFQSLI